MAELIPKIKNLESEWRVTTGRIAEVHQEIKFHHHYSSVFNQLEPKLKELQTRLAKIDGQLGLSEKFENALTDQRAYWRMVSLSYKEIKMKVTFKNNLQL